MDVTGIISQAIAIMAQVSNIQAAFDYNETPAQLNEEDLPAAIAVIGPMTSRDVSTRGGRASAAVLETLDVPLRIYITPITQSYDVGEAVNETAAFFTPVLNAFDARPHLVNADGSSPTDFDWQTAGLMRAFIISTSGIVIRPYGERNYFAIEFTLRCDGTRTTARVSGN